MSQVFLSYSRKDLPFVERLAQDLKAAGLDVWYDLSGLEGGQRWGSEIQNAILQSQYFIIVLSSHSVGSEWVEKEFMYAHNLKRKIVPILHHDCEPPMWVSNLHFIDMQKGNYQKNLTHLLGVLGVENGTEKDDHPDKFEKPVKRTSRRQGNRGSKIVLSLVGLVLVGLFVMAGMLWGKDLTATLFSTETSTSTTTPSSTITPTNTATTTPTLTPTLGVGSTIVRPSDGMTMLYVPESQFTMGNAEGLYHNQPPHLVYLDAFWIDQTEVTNAMYALCVSADQCDMPHRVDSETRDSYFGISDYADFPVIAVDWEDARDYCAWAGGRLPTEAEWEKAARGSDKRVYPWGNDPSSCSLENSWVEGPCAGDTAPVGTYPMGVGPFGTLDQAGNVQEWVADFLGTYPATLISNPMGPASGVTRVARGGSLKQNSFFSQSFIRGNYSPNYYSLDLGFRCALNSP
jgi:formylglycine-generating enzyme required for sulfatase activity